MEIPKEIIVIPKKNKKPIINDKKKGIKILFALLTTTAWTTYIIYYPAPQHFTVQNTTPIAIMCTLTFCQILSIAYLMLPFKKALLIATMLTATLAIKKKPIITIITYAICIPLLFTKQLQQQIK